MAEVIKMTKQEVQDSGYFKTLSASDQEAIMQSSLKFDTEDDIRNYISTAKRA
jgi:hypothetical protein